mmetsp:Transcript_3820/g.10852  ORF Transcript_3820/g.10852 Transcript_3820/m.10852 type:complete len:206 (+) Transcript_3820:2495-3112(+)
MRHQKGRRVVQRHFADGPLGTLLRLDRRKRCGQDLRPVAPGRPPPLGKRPVLGPGPAQHHPREAELQRDHVEFRARLGPCDDDGEQGTERVDRGYQDPLARSDPRRTMPGRLAGERHRLCPGEHHVAIHDGAVHQLGQDERLCAAGLRPEPAARLAADRAAPAPGRERRIVTSAKRNETKRNKKEINRPPGKGQEKHQRICKYTV